jgi:pimeloyl-ACP methyl ester carboxylesterase
MAGMAPERVRSVLVWGAAGVFNDPHGEIRAIFDRAVDDPVPGYEGLRDHLVARYGADMVRRSLQSFVAAVTAIAASGGNIGYDGADRIACPVLLVVGESDTFVQRSDVEALSRRISKGQMLLAEGAGHLVHEDRTEWFDGIVKEWLSRT